MTITVRFFATYRQLIEKASIEIEIPEETTVISVIEQLEAQYPQLEDKLHTRALIAINEAYAERRAILQPRDTLAFFPPVSGG